MNESTGVGRWSFGVESLSRPVYDGPVLQWSAAVLCFVGLVSVLGNITTALALVSCRKLLSATTVFVVNLAVADFLFAFVETPLTVGWFLSDDWTWVAQTCGCPVYVFTSHFFACVSLCSMGAIALTRLLMIIRNHPRKTKRVDWKTVLTGVTLCWMTPACCLLLPLFDIWGKIGSNRNAVGGCSLLNGDFQYSPRTIFYAVGILVPVIFIGICYMVIFSMVWRTRRRIPSLASRRHSTVDSQVFSFSRYRGCSVTLASQPYGDSVIAEGCFPRSLSSSLRNFVRVIFGSEWHLTQMMGLTYIALLVCYIPAACHEILDRDSSSPYINLFVTLLIWVSGGVNPVIYTIMSRQYRYAYVRLMTQVKFLISRRYIRQ